MGDLMLPRSEPRPPKTRRERGAWNPPRGKARFRRAALLGLLVACSGTLAQNPPSAAAQETLRLDNHSKTYPENEPIPGWDSRKISPIFGSGDRFFFQFVHKSEAEHFLHVASGDNNSFTVGAEREFELKDWPVLEWEWKATILPKGGDVRVKSKDDQAASVCVVVDPGLTGFDSFCYVWENKGPKEQPITSTKRDASKYVILRTPENDKLGQWYKEERNIYEDYKKLFGKEPSEKAVVGVQIDSDDTESSGEAFYRNMILRKR